MDPAQLAPVVVSIERGNIVHYVQVASVALFVYDYFMTLADEVNLIWRARFGAGKILFLVVRYITWPELFIAVYIEMFDLPSKLCNTLFTYMSWSLVAGITVAEMVLILRTWAIWDAKRSVLFVLSGILVAITISNSIIIVHYLDHTRLVRAAEALPGLSGCIVVSSTHLIALGWVSIAAFELIIVIMTLIKGIQHFRTTSSTLFYSLYRDGLLYFVFLFALSLVNMIYVYSAPDEFIILFAEMQRAFHAIISCRIILQLREAATKDIANRETMFSAVTATGSFWFGHPRTQGHDWEA